MTKKIVRSVMAAFAVASLVLSTNPSAWAKHEGKGEGHGGVHQGTPPGWEHGKKTGWHGGDKPPGLVKKERGQGRRHHPKKHRHDEKEEKQKEKES